MFDFVNNHCYQLLLQKISIKKQKQKHIAILIMQNER